jgi:hypothetical protein
VRRNFIDESQFQSPLGGIKFAFQNHFSGLFNADQSRQPRAAAPCRKKSQTRFRQTDPRGWIVGCDTIIARKRNFVAAAGRGAMDRGNSWNFKIRQPIENLLPAPYESAHFTGFRCLQQRL